ncbi:MULTISPECIES: hypothetical protein [unclassified Aureimonas]|uniref:hypothetical protein n=1 Tax=unclassified Aureimonas TaxID=2615206 RepID=UPI0012E3B24D|nr:MULTISPECIES: hypothetical protein [unclassified Aureimonas]
MNAAVAMRAIGAGLNGTLDGAKLNETLERIAASVASIAASAATIAKLEEAGTAEAIEAQGRKLDDLMAEMRRQER